MNPINKHLHENYSFQQFSGYTKDPKNSQQLTPLYQNFHSQQLTTDQHPKTNSIKKNSYGIKRTDFSPFQVKKRPERLVSSFLPNQNIQVSHHHLRTQKDIPSRQRYLNVNSKQSNKYKDNLTSKQSRKVSFFGQMPLNNVSNIKQQVSKEIQIHRDISKSISNYLNEKKPVNIDQRQQIIEELTMKNKYLSQQIKEYKSIVAKLQNQIRLKQERFMVEHQNMKRIIQQTQFNSDQLTNQMKEQIKLLLHKNLILTQKIEQHYNRPQINSPPRPHQITKQFQEIKKIISLEYYGKISKDIHIIEPSIQIIPFLLNLIRRNLRLESFAKSLIDMKIKVTKENDKERDLKKCWRWLKSLIQDLYKLKKYYSFEQNFRKKFKISPNISMEQLFNEMQKYFKC